MTAAEALKCAQAAYDANRELTAVEFQAMRDGMNDPNTSPTVRGGLKELGGAIARQSDERRERVRLAAEEERGRQRQRDLDERERKWQALDPAAAALLNAIAEMPNDPTLRILAKHLLRRERGRAPRSFMPELLSEYERMGFV